MLPIILNDKELMYRFLKNSLKEEHNVLDAALDGNPELLSAIPDWLQLQYPDLVVRAIHQWDYGDDDERDLFHWFAP